MTKTKIHPRMYERIFREGIKYRIEFETLEKRFYNFKGNLKRTGYDCGPKILEHYIDVLNNIERDYNGLLSSLEDKPLRQTRSELEEIGKEIKGEKDKIRKEVESVIRCIESSRDILALLGVKA